MTERETPEPGWSPSGAEPRVDELRERFRATFEQAAVGIAHLGIDGQWLRVNQRMCDLTGYTREELATRTFRDVTHPDDLPRDLAQIRRLLEGGPPSFTLEKRYVRKDGAVQWVDRTLSLVRSAEGEPQYLISVVQDIQQRKAAEAAVAELTRTLESRIAERTVELEARAREAEFLVDLMTCLEEEESPEALMAHLVECLGRLDLADAISVSAGTADHGVDVLAMYGWLPPLLEPVRRRRISPAADGGALWEHLRTMRSAWVDDYRNLPDASPVFVEAGTTALAHVPFGHPSGRVGLLTAMRFTVRPPWNEREKGLFEAGARALTLSLARAGRMRAVERAAVYATAMMEVSRLTEHVYDPLETAQRAVAVIARAADVDLGGLLQISSERVRTEVVWSNERASPELLSGVAAGDARTGTLTAAAADREEPLFVDDYRATAAPLKPWLDMGIASVATVPLAAGEEEALAFVAIRCGTARPWTEPDRELFLAAARSVRLAVERRARLDLLEQAALTDALTGLSNRRALGLELGAELSRAARHGQAVCVASLDLDGLKAVNDAFGHATGDLLISTFSDLLKSCLRREDRLYRVGGDEFVVLLPHTSGADATDAVAARIAVAMDRVRAVGFPSAGVSVGFAAWPEDGDTAEVLLAASDARMYADKQRHRAEREP